MSHDELLEKIKQQSRIIYANQNNLLGWFYAFKAVIELHFPIFAEEESLEGYPKVCHHCNRLYPCPTIQAVEKELK